MNDSCMGHEEKVVLITGASKGIGRATALRLAGEHQVVLIARTEKLLGEVVDLIKENHENSNPVMITCDVTDEMQVKNTIQEILDAFGSIDVLINNAGKGMYKPVQDFKLDEFKDIFDVNVFGTFLMTRHVIPHMIRQLKGQIINISSVAGLHGFAGGTAYASSKFAVVGFSESLREEVKHHGIAVTVICPGSVNTTFGGVEPGGKDNRPFLLEPEDVANTIKYIVNQSETANTKLIELKPRKREQFRK